MGFDEFLDDAAVFPPGRKQLPRAVVDHRRHRSTAYGAMVGPLVLAAPALADFAELAPDGIDLSVTAPTGPTVLPDVLKLVANLPVRLAGLEVATPPEMSVPEFFTALEVAGDVPVFVEIPRDQRRPEVISTCAKTGRMAKFRTGGVKAEMYPDEAELAAAITAVVAAEVPFKATAGLHHALRNTDPATGFEQHGFLNLLLATAAALAGAPEAELVTILANRDAAEITQQVSEVDSSVRTTFRSFGTCDITDPVSELVGLGLIPAELAEGRTA